jgi:hypothetical protein
MHRNKNQKSEYQGRHRNQVLEPVSLQPDHASTSSPRFVFTPSASESKLDFERQHFIGAPTESAFRVSTDGHGAEIGCK